MQTDRKNRILLALILGAYFGLATLLLNPFTFLGSGIWSSSALVATISALCILVFSYFQQRMEENFKRKMWMLVALFISPVIAGLSIWTLYPAPMNESLLYLSSFVISALLPISIAILWLIFNDLKTKITISGKDESEPEIPVLKLTNEKGKVLLKVKLSDVICFEANDNYVITYYLVPDKGLSKVMERVALKRICEIVEELNVEFQRVHKSFLINPTYVKHIDGKSQAYRIHMEYLDKEIPVSRSFDISRIEA